MYFFCFKNIKKINISLKKNRLRKYYFKDIKGRSNQTWKEKLKAKGYMRRTLKHDKANEAAAGIPPITNDVTHIRSDCIITELCSILANF